MHTIVETDVLVIGAGAAGWPAAIGAARAGASVILLEEDAVPGGAAMDQYVLMLDGGPRSGVITELCNELDKNYPLTERKPGRWWDFWYMPGDYLMVLSRMLTAEKNITVRCGVRVERLMVEDAGNRRRVTGAIWRGADGKEQQIKAKVTIEATGVGNLCVNSGMDGRYGEDSRDDFGEGVAPMERTDHVQLCTWKYISQKIGNVPHFDFRQLKLSFPLESGEGWPKGDIEGLKERNIGAYLHWGCKVRCADTREPGILATAQREALNMMSEDIILLRKNGYAVHLAPKLGVREQWRIMGEKVITSEDIFNGIVPDDSVHVTQRSVDIWSEKVKGMSDFPEPQPYGIPYRSLIPRDYDGIMVVGKHMSGTHLAMASYRVQCILAQIGQSAGVAGSMCAQGDTQPNTLDFADIKPRLLAPPQNIIIRKNKEWVTPPNI
ncbi:MAG: FAD-dependent oxidoreductase [bacterium]